MGRPSIPFAALVIFTSVVLLSSPLFAAGDQEESSGESIAVSILPMKYFADRITGGDVEVTVLVPPGKSPATYEPTPRQVTTLSESAVLFTIGVPFERSFIPTIASTLPDLRIVDTSEGIEKREIQSSIEPDGHDGDDHDGHSHDSGLQDPHIWLAPRLVKIQAEHMLNALAVLYPEKKDEYTDNYRAFIADLDRLHGDMQEILSPVKGSSILVYHPSFGYFAEEFGLSQIPIELGGNEPTPRLLEKVIDLARDRDIRVIFVQPEFSKTSAERVAQAIDGAVVEVAPLRPDYLENMYDIAARIEAGIRSSGRND
ncbi:MAG: metal ABC transporter solute-binding protein, Zn/Mn family [Sediminispirochaetaceae bacterium]